MGQVWGTRPLHQHSSGQKYACMLRLGWINGPPSEVLSIGVDDAVAAASAAAAASLLVVVMRVAGSGGGWWEWWR